MHDSSTVGGTTAAATTKVQKDNFLSAIRGGDIEVVIRILKEADEDTKKKLFTPQDGDASIALTVAARDAPKETAAKIVGLLLSHGANIDGVDRNERTALVQAAFEGRFDVVKALLDKGANVELRDIRGYTALSWAILGRGTTSIADLLMDHMDNKSIKASLPLATANYKNYVLKLCWEELMQ